MVKFMEDIYQRTSIIIGNNNIEKIKSTHVLVCGIGGVGSFVVEALARIGVGEITIVDKDKVDITNINRQLIALNSTVGKYKVEVEKDRIKDINPNILVNILYTNITNDNIDKVIQAKIDYIVDCVDNIEAKIAIISKAHERGIRCISCMGMGNKLNPLDIFVDDIYNTHTCPLARVIRKKLKTIGIKKQKVVFSIEKPIKNNENIDNTLGSVSFVPSVAGLIIASEVVKDLLNLN